MHDRYEKNIRIPVTTVYGLARAGRYDSVGKTANELTVILRKYWFISYTLHGEVHVK